MFYSTCQCLQLEQQYQELHSQQHVTKVENVKLKQNNDELARELDHASQELTLAQGQLSILQEQSTRLHEEKEMCVQLLQVSLGAEIRFHSACVCVCLLCFPTSGKYTD